MLANTDTIKNTTNRFGLHSPVATAQILYRMSFCNLAAKQPFSDKD
jgi:hypothetical protein